MNSILTPMANVLLLVADDLGRQLGCYGASNPKTPNIDALAASGTTFTHAFASTASCSGSRSTIYTGLHTHQNGMYGLNGPRMHFSCFDNVESGAAILNRRGYKTGIIGKVHVGPANVFPWQVRRESGTRDVRWVADEAARFFDDAKSEESPFFLTVGYVDPHRDLTRAGFGNTDDLPGSIQRHTYAAEDLDIPDFLADLPAVRQELASYFESIDRLDQGVGMMLQELQNSGLADNTLIIFMSDNGPPFLNSKTTLYDAGVHLPLVVKAPQCAKGILNPNMISYVDILPTILEFAGGNEPNRTDAPRRLGRSFLDILDKSSLFPDWNSVCGSHTFHEVTNYWPTRFLRTRRYKYHRNLAWRLDFPFAADLYGSLTWEDVRDAEKNPSRAIGGRALKDYFFRPAEELYDLDVDPREVVNLAQSGEHASVLADMRTRLEAWQVATNDMWLFRDGVSVLLNRRHLAEGMVLPDRLDIDADSMDSKGVKAYKDPWDSVQN